ncbi:dolichyl-phosphate-mannose--protein mannosyltransferase [Bifidobacterium choloepi]|uniref:Polyprenol-phosphate-mannose--protein mannosyltransferase n=1 Tax=Bifidobacterium choloepi TaxID=2614131 RepID=A0A6I5N1M2_9BIFI|nr:phospholipid carrier-dependent glycosyltransferase [Bifidobacterium choloepi]NEG70517.1 phospholipid carrier-dependent glycosyltransferase [Bifidobacterium choloepi]
MVWLFTLLVTLGGGLLRWFRLGEPKAVVFDETYYVKDAWTMLMTGEARNWPDTVFLNGAEYSVNDLFASGNTDNWLPSAEYVVHPPVGKWLIALGLKLFGGAGSTVAWRASCAIAGTVAILLLIRVVLRLFHNVSVAMLAGILMSIDGVGIVMSRTGILDIFIMVLALGAFQLLLMHRDWAVRRLREQYAIDSRRRDAEWVPNRANRSKKKNRKNDSPRPFLLRAKGPRLFFSWYRLAATFLLGMATGVKWSGIYFFAAFAVLSVLWDAWNRREAGYYSWFGAGLKEGLLAACYMLPLYVATYVAGWANWFMHSDSYLHDWAAKNPGEGITWLPEGLRSFVEYHREMWIFHTHLDVYHAYRANPLTWPLQIRPTSFYWEKVPTQGLCTLSPNTQCVAAVTSLGNPIIWWLGSLCAIIAIVIAIVKRGDWKIWAVLIGFIGGWLPWAQYLNRTTFTFYSIVILPWMILSICYVFNEIRKAADATLWKWVWGITVGICGLVSLFFYPIWTAMPVPYDFWLAHMWLQSWI